MEPVTVLVRVDAQSFRAFALFDQMYRQKRWRGPLLFAAILLVSALICLSQTGKRQGAGLLAAVLAVVALGLPAVYFGSFVRSASRQSGAMGLAQPKEAYRLTFGADVKVSYPLSSMRQPEQYDWEHIYGAWRTDSALYLYARPDKAFILPAGQIPGGADALWDLLCTRLDAARLHRGR